MKYRYLSIDFAGLMACLLAKDLLAYSRPLSYMDRQDPERFHYLRPRRCAVNPLNHLNPNAYAFRGLVPFVMNEAPLFHHYYR